jgi:hypothetical protein
MIAAGRLDGRIAMTRQRHWFGRPDPQEEANRQTASLAGLAFALALVVVSLLLVRELRHCSHVEDCLLAGHADCDSLVGDNHGG